MLNEDSPYFNYKILFNNYTKSNNYFVEFSIIDDQNSCGGRYPATLPCIIEHQVKYHLKTTVKSCYNRKQKNLSPSKYYISADRMEKGGKMNQDSNIRAERREG